MGYSRWSSKDWATYSNKTKTMSVDKIYTSTSMNNLLDPKDAKIRESRDSDLNPESTAVIVGTDITGSMGMLAEIVAKKSLGTVIEEIIARKPVTDPHVMVACFGDVRCDSAPLQVTQFEASNVLVDQLEKMYIERGGGGNSSESEDALWYYAATHTSIDCFDKRHTKGFLFTAGDECFPLGMDKEHIKQFIGDNVQVDYKAEELLAMVQRMYNVYHITIQESGFYRSYSDRVESTWREHLGQHVIPCSDHTKLAEIIVSTIQAAIGLDKKTVAASWDGSTSVVVANAIKDIAPIAKSISAVVKL